MALQTCGPCQNGGHESIYEIYISLKAATSHKSCPWCELLSETADVFGNLWSHLPISAREKVRYLVQRSLFGSEPKLYLQWPSSPLEHNANINDCFDIDEGVNSNFKATEIEIVFERRPPQALSWLPWSIVSDRASLSESSSSPQCIELIESWLHKCDDEHNNCKPESTIPVERPTRLLQIIKSEHCNVARLIQTEMAAECKYIAFSHCWGKLPVYKTTFGNLASHMTSGMSVSDLPKSFQDAIDITWRLGIEHIWIDSICINQDDSREWQIECTKMGSIYGNAHLVIAASLASDASVGCYETRRKHKIDFLLGQETVSVFVQEAIDHNVWKKDEPSWQVFDDSKLPLFHRAWAFQERLMARRIVHYTPRELVWECRSKSCCECQVLDNTVSDKGRFPFSMSFKARYAEVVNWGGDTHRLEMWLAVVDQYMARGITKPSDRLLALSAIARQIDRPPIMGKYVAGMWEPWLDRCLLWWSDHRSTRKPTPGTATHVRPNRSSIPTWSWLSVEGLVSTWGRNPDSLLKIMLINHQSSVNDPYAESSNASLVLEGRIVPIQLTAEPEAPVLERYPIKTASTSRFGLLIPDTNPLEIGSDMLPTTTFIAIEYSVCERPLLNCLILTRDSKNMNAFRRLGLAELDESFFIGTGIQQFELV